MERFLTFLIPVVVGVSLGLILVVVRDWIKTPVQPLDEKTFTESMRKGQLIDVRKPAAFEQSHIKGARNFSLRAMVSKSQAKVRKDLPIYLVHQTAFKAKRAAKKLGGRGFKTVFYLNQSYPQTKTGA
jgi:rhodanese-related sulfurtransferase